MTVRLIYDNLPPEPVGISSAEEIIAEALAGRMFILADDEDRENEGDLVIPAQFATPAVINFMAMHGRGLICLTMERSQIERLGLLSMSQNNGTRYQTAFMTSIEAREGVTTGISAADRARTIQVAIAPNAGPRDIVTPGHIFPIQARDGGVLERAGHTEASVDVARIAGLIPAGVICEIMNEDGTMAHLDDLRHFAARHHLKIGTISDLIAYRRRTETLIARRLTTAFHSVHGGEFKLSLYTNLITGAEHVALVKGDISPVKGPVLVRMHALNILEDVMGDRAQGHGGALHASMRMVAKEGRGVVVLMRDVQAVSLARKLETRRTGVEVRSELRDNGVGAQILLDLGVRDMIVLSNTQRAVIGLDGYGLRIVGQRPIDAINLEN